MKHVSEILAPLVVSSLGLARLQQFLDHIDPEERWDWISDWLKFQTITEAEAKVLRQHNLEAA